MLVLLDIDGVMLSGASWKKVENLDDNFSNFDKRAVANLQKIISETHASIVLTTSHKSRFSISEWKNIFKKRGIIVYSLETLDSSNYSGRKDEILHWFNNRTVVESFVIIDDDKSLNGLPVYIKERCVITDSYIGLNENDARTAISILKSQTTPSSYKEAQSNRPPHT